MVSAHGKGPNSMDSSEIMMKPTFLPNVITLAMGEWDDCEIMIAMIGRERIMIVGIVG